MVRSDQARGQRRASGDRDVHNRTASLRHRERLQRFVLHRIQESLNEAPSVRQDKVRASVEARARQWQEMFSHVCRWTLPDAFRC